VSALHMPNGDDHPDAANKHLLDAAALLAQHRPDGAAYLSGYVVECALKSLYAFETGKGMSGHNFKTLVKTLSAVAMVAGSKSARYFGSATQGVLAAPIGSWDPEMRYRSSSMTVGDAQVWHDDARAIFQETIHQMRLDGVL